MVAIDAFARTLTAADANVVTVLDGTIGGTEGKRPDTERRIAAARATVEATALTERPCSAPEMARRSPPSSRPRSRDALHA